jgi:signal transduction histidine kinase
MSLSADEQERLVLLDRAHGVQQLLRGLAHDLRNNLQVVSLASQLGDDGRTPEIDRRVEQAIEDITEGLDFLSSMGRSLADGATTSSLGGLVKQLHRTVTYQRNIAATRVRFGPCPDAKLALPPAAALQILLNLITNAKEASPPTESVEVAFRRLPATVEIEISDRGAGLPADSGEPFASSHPAAAHAGTGLFAARAMAIRFGGSVEWQPRPEGGTRIRIALPTAD